MENDIFIEKSQETAIFKFIKNYLEFQVLNLGLHLYIFNY